MTVQTINLGNVVNDGLGDDLRTAFEKVNANFSELNSLGTIVGINLSTIGAAVFKQNYINSQGENVLEFKTLITGDSNTLQIDGSLPNTIKLTANVQRSFNRIETDDLAVTTLNSNTVSLKGGITTGGAQPDIIVTVPDSQSPNSIEIRTVLPITDTLTNYDFGEINSQASNIIEIFLATLNLDFGTIDAIGDFNLDFGTL
jgi:hypothetical protein